jgi:hypothetical protein
MMSLRHGWRCHPIQTASSIPIKNIQNVWAHCYAVHRHKVAALLSYTNPTWLRIWWSWSLSQNDVITSWLRLPSASHILISHVHSVWAHWYTVHRHKVVSRLTQLYWPYLAQILVIWVTYGVKMMSLHHCWSCHPIQTTFTIHIRHMISVWAHSYAVHRHNVAGLLIYSNPTWLRFW